MKVPILSTPLHWRAGMALGALSALSMWLAYFPVDWGFFAWFALVPLLLVVRLGTAWSIRLAEFVGLYGFYLAALAWMRVADPTMARGWPLLALYCTLFSWLAVLLLRRIELRLGLPFVITMPIVWTAIEFFRGQFLGGFAWYFLAHTQHDCLLLRQSADVGGELALTLLVAAVNGLIADLVTRRGRATVVSLIGVGSLLCVYVMYGAWRLSQFDFGVGPKVAILQGNISQDLKNGVFANGFEAGKKFINDHYAQLSSRVVAERPDLVIWPETSVPIEIAILREVPIESLSFEGRLIVEGGREYLARIARQTGIDTLVGTNTTVLGPGKSEARFNSALLLDGEGNIRYRYDKIHRVPFGEFVPLREQFPWLQKLTPYEGSDYSITAGTNFTRFPIRTTDRGEIREFQFGALICYEDSDAALARKYVADPESAVDFLVNITNDGWFKGTAEHDQHLAVSRFRAVETRRSLVRSVNMGISAIIDPSGQVTHLPGPSWRESKGMDGVIVAHVPINQSHSLYARFGDWLPWSCWAFVVIMCVWPRRIK